MTSSRPESRPDPAPECGEPIRLERLLAALPARRRSARRIRLEQRLQSSNDELKRLSATDRGGNLDGLLVLAEEQTGGRGRRARDWWSGPPATNLSFSLMLTPPPQPAEAFGLLAGCAVCAAIERWCPIPVALKWPNDVLIAGAKVAGLLVELPVSSNGAVLGLGINLSAAPPSSIAPYPVSSVGQHALVAIDRTAFLVRWIWEFERRLARFERVGPRSLEQEFLTRLRRWAPDEIQARNAQGEADGAPGPLLEFALSTGLTWGRKGAERTCPLGLVPRLEPCSGPAIQ